MDTELLKTFLEVSRTRHFGRAAESLYLTQSAVSFRIRQLENQLGANLFTRHRNNIRLTPAGERLLPYAETLMSTWQLAKKRWHTRCNTLNYLLVQPRHFGRLTSPRGCNNSISNGKHYALKHVLHCANHW